MKIYAMAQDPIYIGTGGFTIGRVDNTIVRDPITNIPKIPGTSVAGTWRYYMALTIHSCFKEKYRLNRKSRKQVKIEELFNHNMKDWITDFEGNRYAAIKCAGQDDEPNIKREEAKEKGTGHCGHCIVCKTFGFSKKDKSQRGMTYFSDLNIFLFPVYTRLGTRWITSKGILDSIGIETSNVCSFEDGEVLLHSNSIKHINLGWLNFTAKEATDDIYEEIEKYNNFNISKDNIIIVSDNIIHQIINSNLETRTSVSIDPLTGAAKEHALFTSEAIPRGTVFWGDLRMGEHPLKDEPDVEKVKEALKDSKKYFETLGIGGMTTRGFGRLKILGWGEEDGNRE